MNYMSVIDEIITNAVLMSAVLSWLFAQVMKTVLHTVVTRQFNAERLVGTGGMPSSHSATVCGLAGAVCIRLGPGSTEFALAAALAIIVMYDALGIRRQAGKQAKVLNEMIDSFERLGEDNLSAEDKLKEFLGHTPLQVLVGAAIGILFSFLVCNVLLPY